MEAPCPAALVSPAESHPVCLYLGRRTLELSCDWRHWTVMKMVLDVFGKFNKIDFINSRFGADRCLLVYLAVNHFEVLGKRAGCG